MRLVNACEPAFRNLVRGALLTGCRYSELATPFAKGTLPAPPPASDPPRCAPWPAPSSPHLDAQPSTCLLP